jgi:hypothetical protein
LVKFLIISLYLDYNLSITESWLFKKIVLPVVTDVEELLGRPIQEELAMETGVDVALDALVDVSTG